MSRVEQTSFLVHVQIRSRSGPNCFPRRPHHCPTHVFGGMPQWWTRRGCVASMHELKPPPPVLLVQAPLPPPEWMASSPLLPGVLSRPRALLLALYRGNATASTMADCLSSHPLRYSLLRAFLAQAKFLSATAVSF